MSDTDSKQSMTGTRATFAQSTVKVKVKVNAQSFSCGTGGQGTGCTDSEFDVNSIRTQSRPVDHPVAMYQKRNDSQARQMTTPNPLAKHTGNRLAGWLICNGFRDQKAADAACRSLDVPCLKPLWTVLQRKMRSRAGRATVPAYTAETSDPESSDPCDQKVVQEERLTKLTEQVQSVMRQLYVAQVRNT